MENKFILIKLTGGSWPPKYIKGDMRLTIGAN